MPAARTITRRACLAASLLAFLALPGSAAADSFGQIYQNYQTSGTIQSCHYSASQLNSAIGNTPPDIQNYDPGFGSALNNALGANCGGGGTTVQTSAPGAAPTTTATPAAIAAARRMIKRAQRRGPPHPLAAFHKVPLPAGAGVPGLDPERNVPMALIVLAAALGLALLAGGTIALRHYMGWNFATASGPALGAGRPLRERIGDAALSLRARLPGRW